MATKATVAAAATADARRRRAAMEIALVRQAGCPVELLFARGSLFSVVLLWAETETNGMEIWNAQCGFFSTWAAWSRQLLSRVLKIRFSQRYDFFLFSG